MKTRSISTLPMKLKNESGLTLIELMISIMIMAGLSLLIAQAINSGVRSKKKIEVMLEKETLYADVIKIIEQDINRAWHYRDFHFEIVKAAKEARAKAKNKNKNKNNNGNPNQAPAIVSGPGEELKAPVKLTHFEGTKDTLNFTALSNYRIRKNSQESQQAEVGYFTKSCKRNKEDRDGSLCLFRRISPYIDEDITRGGTETVLLHDIDSISFRYFGEGRDEWLDRWSTKERAEPHSKDKFPIAVEVTLKINKENKTKKVPPIVRTLVASVRFPNNAKPEEPKKNKPPIEGPITSGGDNGN